jgi:predicted MPP superfamily phosphohydrolase
LRSSAGFSLFEVLFLVAVLGLLFLAQQYWFRAAWRLIGGISSRRRRRLLQSVLIAAAIGLLIAVSDRLILHFLPRRGPGLWLVPSFFAVPLMKLVQAAEWIWDRLVPRTEGTVSCDAGKVDPGRRAFFRYTAGFAGALPLFAALYGYAKDRLQYTVRRVEVPVANLPAALEGFQIVQLSDIHAGDFMPVEEIRHAVGIANGLGAQVAFVTGDFVTGAYDPLEACIAELSQLKAPLGVWACNGNHEIYAAAEEEAQRLFQKHGMRLLRQESAPLHWRDGEINLIGVDYQRERRPMLTKIESLVRRDVPNLLLSHNPNSFYRAAELGIELSLAGHTHGGQVQVEILDHTWSPARFITRFVAGLYALPMGGGTSRAMLYVNRGLGSIGVPARLGVNPEITLLTLHKRRPTHLVGLKSRTPEGLPQLGESGPDNWNAVGQSC